MNFDLRISTIFDYITIITTIKIYVNYEHNSKQAYFSSSSGMPWVSILACNIFGIKMAFMTGCFMQHLYMWHFPL